MSMLTPHQPYMQMPAAATAAVDNLGGSRGRRKYTAMAMLSYVHGMP